MSKAANIYWGDPPTQRTALRRSGTASRKASARPARRTAPWWLSFLIVVSIFVMLCVSINFRAFSEMKEEAGQNERLAIQIQALMDENLALQDEIHALRTDPAIIKREAKRIGVDLKAEKVPVPSN